MYVVAESGLLIFDVLNNLTAAIEAQNMESGKWYVRKQRPDFNS